MKLLVIFLFISVQGFSQTDTLKVMTSAVCEMCKKTIEHDMSFEKGVKKISLDVENKLLTVIYDPKKTSPEKIRIAITKTGYDADSLKADPKAFKRLPECCRNPDQH